MIVAVTMVVAIQQQFRKSKNRADRSANFVANAQKIGLGTTSIFGRVACRRQLTLSVTKIVCGPLKFCRSRFDDSGSVFDDGFQVGIQILQAPEAFGGFQVLHRQLSSGTGQYEVHFTKQVANDSIPTTRLAVTRPRTTIGHDNSERKFEPEGTGCNGIKCLQRSLNIRTNGACIVRWAASFRPG